MIIDGKSVALIAAGLTAVMGHGVWVWQESQLALFLDRCLCFRLCQVRRVFMPLGITTYRCLASCHVW